MYLDHVVLWVTDPLKTARWLMEIVGFGPVRVDEYERGESPFPSVRVNDNSIIDLSPIADAPAVNEMTKTPDSSGFPVNHVCIALSSRDEYEQLAQRFEAAGVDTSARRQVTYGARAYAPEAFYIRDTDNNTLEFRYYGD
jgi:catechol 2,3-dioxygenase-like lactoylglutathione lyase family enzyme